ncbi:EpsG family protein [Adlercreutzia sp. ZJ138]|uniref:EpsG family protein n=1 Tax=Adlercreutzia sp. ZJ138 TaxID=2709405 RepID=UPI0013ECA904|nr:EpsG family protein [Adlercreutzia sp. ZJ138]
MTAYLVLLLLVFLVFLLIGGVAKRQKGALCVIFAMLAVVMACRAPSVGTDTMTAISVIKQAIMTPFPQSWRFVGGVFEYAPVYALWCKGVWAVVPSVQAVLAANSLVICLCFAFFFREFSENPAMAAVLFLLSYTYLTAFNIMRQELAVGVCLVAFVLWSKRKRAAAILLAALAIGIHGTAVVFALSCVVLLSVLRKRDVAPSRMLAWALAIGLILRIAYIPLTSVFFGIFYRYGEMYSISSTTYTSQGRASVLYLAILMYFVLELVRRREAFLVGGVQKQVLFFAFLAISLRLLFFDLALMVRIAGYFTPFLLCSLSNALQENIRRDRDVFLPYLLISLMVAYYVALLLSNSGGVVPYELWSGV